MPSNPMFNTGNTGPAYGGGGSGNSFQDKGRRTIAAQLGGNWERDAAQVRQQVRAGGESIGKPTTGGGAEVIQFPSRGGGGGGIPSTTRGTPTIGSGAIPGQTSPGAIIAIAGAMANEDGPGGGGGKLGEAGEQGFGEATPPPMPTATGATAGSEWASPYTSGPGGGSTGSPLPPPMPPSFLPPPKSPKVTKKSSITAPMIFIGAVVLAKLLKFF